MRSESMNDIRVLEYLFGLIVFWGPREETGPERHIRFYEIYF